MVVWGEEGNVKIKKGTRKLTKISASSVNRYFWKRVVAAPERAIQDVQAGNAGLIKEREAVLRHPIEPVTQGDGRHVFIEESACHG